MGQMGDQHEVPHTALMRPGAGYFRMFFRPIVWLLEQASEAACGGRWSKPCLTGLWRSPQGPKWVHCEVSPPEASER